MLRQTFQHLQGVTARRECELWREGVVDWQALRARLNPQPSLFRDTHALSAVEQGLDASEVALLSGDFDLFERQLDRREHYRICLAVPRETLFLDIETTGLSRYYDHITVIGWALGPRYGFFVKGHEDQAFRQALAGAKAVVTFNGTLFDLPFIRQEFPGYRLPSVHVDLRFLARRVGLVGGQKEIERLIGVRRKGKLSEVAGEAAPILWAEYTRGSLDALKLLLEYNAADIWGMKHIFDVSVGRLLREQGYPLDDLPVPKMLATEFADRQRVLRQTIKSELLPWEQKDQRKVRIEDLVYVDRSPRLKVVGIDLTGSEARPSGWCSLYGREVETATLSGDEEIIARTVRENPNLVSIDSPLSLPQGRVSVDDSDPGRAEYGIMRYCERVLKRRGVNVYPALIPSMQRLTARGMRLAGRLRSMGLPVIESYPGAAQDIMGIPRKRKGLEYLEQGLAEFGVSGPFVTQQVTHDELDAITSAIVGVFFWAGRVERLGADPLGEEALIIPDLRVDPQVRRGRVVVGLSGLLGAGKTTAARHLEACGFTYCRYSEVIQRIVAEKKPVHSREDLQEEGQRVHIEFGQRWLGRELLRSHQDTQHLVIDGLRFPHDHAFLTEIYGAQFWHIHVVAAQAVRRERYELRESASFDAAEAHAVEQAGHSLSQLTSNVLENNGSMEHFLASIDRYTKLSEG